MDRKIRIRGTVYYSLVQLNTWSFYSILMSFSGNVLRSFGFSDSKISLLMGTAALLALLLQLVIGELSGRFPDFKVSYILTVLSGTMLFSALLLRFFHLSLFASAAAFGICCVIVHLIPPLSNGLGMDANRRGAGTNYSLARGLGSLGYSLYAFVTGTLVRSNGEMAVPAVAAFSATVLLISVICYHRTIVAILPAAIEEPNQIKSRRNSSFLRKYPHFALFLIGAVLLQIGHALVNNFMFQIMQHKNGGAYHQGIAAAVSAFSEMPIMFLFARMLKKMRCDKWVRIAAVGMLFKPLAIILAPTPAAVCLAQSTQLIGYGLWAISSVNYAELLVEKGESVQAQSYLGASVTSASLIGLYTGGVICQYLGVNAMLLIALGCCAFGGLFILFTAQKTRECV